MGHWGLLLLAFIYLIWTIFQQKQGIITDRIIGEYLQPLIQVNGKWYRITTDPDLRLAVGDKIRFAVVRSKLFGDIAWFIELK